MRHVLDGNVKGGSGSGGHVGSSPNIRITSQTTDPQTGLIRADIEVYNPNTGVFHEKDQASTLFPTDWNDDRVLAEISEAFANSRALANPGTWEGTSLSGLKIQGHYDGACSWTTGWPK